jgi:hypothetical protein
VRDQRDRLHGRLDCVSGWMLVFGTCSSGSFGWVRVLVEHCICYDDPLQA